MGEFQRSSSKVWWLDEGSIWERRASSSPGSQDSGFSDTETSPTGAAANGRKLTKADKTPAEIKQDLSKSGGTADKSPNLLSSLKEKSTPKKCLMRPQDRRSARPHRNLFTNIQMQDADIRDQYAESVDGDVVETQRSSKAKSELSYSWMLNENSEIPEAAKSLPVANGHYREDVANLSAPAHLMTDTDELITSFNQSLNSDCDSELELLFADNIQSPQHTSTPKTPHRKAKTDLHRIRAMNLMIKYQNERYTKEKLHVNLFDEEIAFCRVPPTTNNSDEDRTALDMWLKTIRQLYDSECMTTLQCKSIAAELQEKVNLVASKYTNKLREILTQSNFIEREFSNIQT